MKPTTEDPTRLVWDTRNHCRVSTRPDRAAASGECLRLNMQSNKDRGSPGGDWVRYVVKHVESDFTKLN